MRWRAARIVVLVLLVSATLTPAHAQSERLTIERINADDYPFIDVTVTVPSSLTDFSLSTDAFSITENGEPRAPSLGNDPDAPRLTPPRVVLAIDVSGSMDPAIAQARDAADAFVGSLPDGSEVAIVTFGDRVEVPLDFTANVEAVRSAIAGIDVERDAETALNDGVLRAAELLPARGDAPASIIVLSDGKDTESAASQRDAINAVAERDTTLWAVALEGNERDPAALEALAGDGGRVVPADNATQLESIYAGFASELSRRYLLRYESRASGATEIGVFVEWNNVSSQQVTTFEIEGQPRADAAEAPVADPETFTVSIAPLGTRAAFAAGLGAFIVGTLMLWLLVLWPRQPGTRQRILGEQTERTWSRLGELAEWTTDVADRRLRNAKLGRGIDRLLEGAGLDLRPGEVVVIVASASIVAFAIGYLSGGLLLGLLLIPIPTIATRLVLARRRDRRQTAFSDQLTDVLQLITGSLRAGYGLLQGIDAVARDGDEPAASEFRRILVEHRLGRDLSDAMEGCAERMANPDFSWVVQAIGIHRDVGGDLGRVLDNITATIRDRGDVHRQVRALSAEGRMAALVLTALPFVVLVVIQITSPDYTSVLFTQPAGWIMLTLAALLMLTGTLWIRRLVRIRY
jgi:tight adherence protein B